MRKGVKEEEEGSTQTNKLHERDRRMGMRNKVEWSRRRGRMEAEGASTQIRCKIMTFFAANLFFRYGQILLCVGFSLS